MAGGKLTPRQKMINLMYLVFIAMLALNMSKEVLSAFGLMNEQFEEANIQAKNTNKDLHGVLAQKASESPQFAEAKNIADKVKNISNSFYTYIEGLKGDITKHFEKENGKLPYEAMDKGEMIDEAWFAGDGYSKKGQEIIATINKYKADMIAAFGTENKYNALKQEINSKFSTEDIKDGEGVKKKYLDYHYKGFPAIASLTKLSAMQNNVETMEANVYNIALGKAAIEATSMNKYKAIVITDKSAFFSGEKVTGKVVLGRYDDQTVPTRVGVDGGVVKMENGQANFEITAGSVGEHDLKGQFVFLEDGKEIEIPITGNYAVVPRPNEATISADKMNSVYRGLDNPMTISFAGIADSDVTATAPGLKKATGAGKYNWNVTTISGTKAIVNVTGKLPDGTSVNSKKEFIVRDIPAPTASIRGKINSSKGRAQDLAISTVNVEFPGFVYNVEVDVVSFELYVPGQPGMIVQGNRFDGKAQAAINRAKRGDQIQIMAIKTKLKGGGSYRMQESSPFIWEVQ
ncbi:gliding motility protein GldM [Flavobacterium salilacus subsp. salilacus]|uniref:type IX secretion system motor protein PorM/GldM n=1 Tax=Flavobacterium TaxID=237 RepID=UPI001074AA68|nr:MULTISPECIES: gliding motility protein GldM [Flavobacterium]KAF2519870.1 gliding motility protein GldM [Flavobacterium salilacus subsp. salilacus]MBE1614226.1 gliding motility protein GldM [Flavobacterium sp. SaA2.13]